jgi:broad-specificity NMP kinase
MGIDVIVIKGTPGAGKSETAKVLSKFFPKGVRMEVDTIRAMVISVDWKNQQEHINMIQVATEMVYNFLKFDYKPIIIVDTFSGDKINAFLKELNKMMNALSVKVFGLYVTDEELKRRLELRSNDKFKDFAISKKQNDDILNMKNENEILIDTTYQTAEETASKIYNILISDP